MSGVKIEKRTVYAKENMKVTDIMQNGNSLQKKYACIFDADRNGIFDAKEAKLFNATTIKENKDGSLTLYTQFSSDKKVKNTVNSDEIGNTKLQLMRMKKGSKTIDFINKFFTHSSDFYGSYQDKEPDGKYSIINSNFEPNGYYEIKGNTTTYYTKDNKRSGSVEQKNGREYYKDSNGKTLYSIRYVETSKGVDDYEYYDAGNIKRYAVEHKNKDFFDYIVYDNNGKEKKRYNNCHYVTIGVFDPHKDLFKAIEKAAGDEVYIPQYDD